MQRISAQKPFILRGLIFPMDSWENLRTYDVMVVVGKFIEFCGFSNSREFLDLQTSLSKIHGEIEEIVIGAESIVTPGFVDSHVHPVSAELQSLGCDLSECENLAQAFEKLDSFAKGNQEETWIFAHGFRDEWFPGRLKAAENHKIKESKKSPLINTRIKKKPAKKAEGRASQKKKKLAIINRKITLKSRFKIVSCPQALLLDEHIESERPIVIMRYDGHSYWCNSKALKIAAASEKIKNYREETYAKDSQGILQGVFKDEAMKILKEAFPEITFKNKLRCGKEALRKLLAAGITSFNDAMTRKTHYDIYNYLYNSEIEDELLYPRCHMTFSYEEFLIKKKDTDIKEIGEYEKGKLEYISKFRLPKSEMVWTEAIKIFVDGVVESKTAFMKEPYHGCTQLECRGVCYYDELKLRKIIKECKDHDYQVHFHSVGDAATNLTIKCLSDGLFSEEKIPILAHLQIVEPSDIEIFKKYNIGANFSPLWCHYDIGDDSGLLGAERAQRQYPINSFFKNNVTVGFGSDWPISSYKPLEGIQIAVTHTTLNSHSDRTLILNRFDKFNFLHSVTKVSNFAEGERVNVAQAVYAYTLGSAKLLGRNNEIGSLEKGKLCDFIVLDKNLFRCPYEEISKISIKLVCVGGNMAKINM